MNLGTFVRISQLLEGYFVAYTMLYRAGGNGLAALVLARPVFLTVKMKSIFTKSE